MIVQKESKGALINAKTNTKLTDFEFDMPLKYHSYFSEGLMAVCKNEKWGFINEEGKTKIPFEYDSRFLPFHFTNGLLYVMKDKKTGVINTKGEVVIPFEYSSIYDAIFEYE